MIYHSHHTRGWNNATYESLADLAETVEDAYKILAPLQDQFDCIVTSGMSGVVVSAPLALRLRKPLVIVRKTEDKSHQPTTKGMINRRDLKSRCLFVDDFTCEGNTRARVQRSVEAAVLLEEDDLGMPARPKIVGEYLYRDNTVYLYERSAS
jgi:adenine/guanine phosphoribosyltransferase-like PRPP-binding protein